VPAHPGTSTRSKDTDFQPLVVGRAAAIGFAYRLLADQILDFADGPLNLCEAAACD